MGADTSFDTPERTSKDRAARLGAAATAMTGVVPLLEGFPALAILGNLLKNSLEASVPGEEVRGWTTSVAQGLGLARIE